MANQENGFKRKTLGYLPVEKVETLKDWDNYKKKVKQFSDAKAETEKAKEAVRGALKQRLQLEGHIDFAVVGDHVRVDRKHRKNGERTRSVDLSPSFIEPLFKRLADEEIRTVDVLKKPKVNGANGTHRTNGASGVNGVQKFATG